MLSDTHTHGPLILRLSLCGSFRDKRQYLGHSHVLWSSRGQEGFPFSICHSFSFLFFADGVAWYVCLGGAREKEKPATGFWVATVTKARFPGPLFVCSQPIDSQRLSPTIHSCKNRKRWKALMTVKGLTRERERGRKSEREGGPYRLLCLSALLSGCSGCSLALWGHLCAFYSIVEHTVSESVSERCTFHPNAPQLNIFILNKPNHTTVKSVISNSNKYLLKCVMNANVLGRRLI